MPGTADRARALEDEARKVLQMDAERKEPEVVSKAEFLGDDGVEEHQLGEPGRHVHGNGEGKAPRAGVKFDDEDPELKLKLQQEQEQVKRTGEQFWAELKETKDKREGASKHENANSKLSGLLASCHPLAPAAQELLKSTDDSAATGISLRRLALSKSSKSISRGGSSAALSSSGRGSGNKVKPDQPAADKENSAEQTRPNDPVVIRFQLEREFQFMRLNLKRARLYNLAYTRIKLIREAIMFIFFILLFYAMVIMLMPLSRAYEHSGQLTGDGAYLLLDPVVGQKSSGTDSFPFFKVRVKKMAQCKRQDITTNVFDQKAEKDKLTARTMCYPEWSRKDSKGAEGEQTDPLKFDASSGLGNYEHQKGLSYLAASRYWSTMQADYISDYGTGGYVHVLKIDPNAGEEGKKKVLEEIQKLQKGNWIDGSARALSINFALYNKHTDIYSIAELLVELPTSGLLLTSYQIRPLYLYLADDGMFNFFLILFALAVVFIFIGELTEIVQKRLDYLTSFWNIVEIALCFGHFYLGWNYAQYFTFSLNANSALTASPPQYDVAIANLSKIKVLNGDVSDVVGIMIVAYGFRLFKYFRIWPSLYVLWQTIVNAWRPIAGFVFVILLIFGAFALTGILVFGFQIYEFRHFTEAYFSLFRFLMGEFNYSDWSDTSRTSGLVFFIVFIVFVVLIFQNIFIAIISNSYEQVFRTTNEEIAEEKDIIEEHGSMCELSFSPSSTVSI
eukprot:tig00000113_g5661.t1